MVFRSLHTGNWMLEQLQYPKRSCHLRSNNPRIFCQHHCLHLAWLQLWCLHDQKLTKTHCHHHHHLWVHLDPQAPFHLVFHKLTYLFCLSWHHSTSISSLLRIILHQHGYWAGYWTLASWYWWRTYLWYLWSSGSNSGTLQLSNRWWICPPT